VVMHRGKRVAEHHPQLAAQKALGSKKKDLPEQPPERAGSSKLGSEKRGDQSCASAERSRSLYAKDGMHDEAWRAQTVGGRARDPGFFRHLRRAGAVRVVISEIPPGRAGGNPNSH